ncbi:hypothetical protein IKZ40_03230 [bacterium]|nr:hypothetical protein [bacterium]
MFKRCLGIVFICFLLCDLQILANDGKVYFDNFDLNKHLFESLSDLQGQVIGIQSQYISITSRLAKIEYDIPIKFQCLSNLFQTSYSKFHVDNNAHIYYDAYELSDFEKFFICSEGDRYDNPDPPSPYATLAQLTAVSNQVVALSASFSNLISNLTSLSNTISSITSSLSDSQGSLQNLTIAYNRLDEICDSLTSTIKINSDGSIDIGKFSPIVGAIEPSRTPHVYNTARNWDRCCSRFRVSKDTQLESITLYCDDISKIPASNNVYISTVTLNNRSAVYSFQSWHCVSVNTSDFPRCVWSFAQNQSIPILSDRDYLLCIDSSNGALYPYITIPYRNGKFYKPYGESEEEPVPPGGPRSGGTPGPDPLTPQEWFNLLFLYDWEESVTGEELWSIFKFTDDESFTFNENGLSVESGNITVAGSSVVTSSSLSDMFVSMLTEYPNLLDSEITWNMFCRELQSNLITRSGGTIIGDLTVSKIRFESDTDWEIGTQNVCSDIVFLNPNSRIRSNAGSLKLSAAQNESISAESFLSFDSVGQAGIVTIPDGQTSIGVACDNLTPQAIIMLTPRQPLSNVWWSVQNGQSPTNFTVRITRELQEPVSFNYVIIRK